MRLLGRCGTVARVAARQVYTGTPALVGAPAVILSIPSFATAVLSSGTSGSDDRAAVPADGRHPKAVVDRVRVVSRFVTYYRCCEPRVTNIKQAAAILDGLTIKPGATFS